MQIDNKIKQTYQSVIGDLRQEFVSLVNTRDKTREENEEKLSSQLKDFKGGAIASTDLQDLNREFEQIIQERGMRADSNYQRLLELLSDLERKQDSKFTAHISEFKNQLPELLEVQGNAMGNQMTQNQQKVLELLSQLENKVDIRDAEVIREATAEVEKFGIGS